MLDTNILVSMIFFKSPVVDKFSQILINNHKVVICDYVFNELKLVTERKFPKRMPEAEKFLRDFPFDLVYTPESWNNENLPKIRDVKDSPILATALFENVDIFVTGDKDCLSVYVESPQIMTMAEFIEIFKS